MANPTLRRLKQLEKRLDKVDPRKREKPGIVLFVDREQFERANAQNRTRSVGHAEAQLEAPQPSEQPTIPVKAANEPAYDARLRRLREQDAAYEAEFEAEFSDKARAKRLRDLAKANEARTKPIW